MIVAMGDLEVISYRPEAGEYAWTFGGAAPVMRLRTPCVLDLYTEDCFAGRVTGPDDLVSRLNITSLNPQTGPFWIEGAEPYHWTPSASTRFTSSPVPRMPPTKSMRLLVRTSAIPSTGPSRRSCSTLLDVIAPSQPLPACT